MPADASAASSKLVDVLAGPDCGARCRCRRAPPRRILCACGLRFPVADGIPRLLSRSLRERIGADGETPVAAADVPAGDLSPGNVVLANHATEPLAHGAEPLASVGMFNPEGHAQRRLREVVAAMAEAGSDLLVEPRRLAATVTAHF